MAAALSLEGILKCFWQVDGVHWRDVNRWVHRAWSTLHRSGADDTLLLNAHHAFQFRHGPFLLVRVRIVFWSLDMYHALYLGSGPVSCSNMQHTFELAQGQQSPASIRSRVSSVHRLTSPSANARSSGTWMRLLCLM